MNVRMASRLRLLEIGIQQRVQLAQTDSDTSSSTSPIEVDSLLLEPKAAGTSCLPASDRLVCQD